MSPRSRVPGVPRRLLFADDLSTIHDRAAAEVENVLCVAGMSPIMSDRKDVGGVVVAFRRRRRFPLVYDEDQMKVLRSYQGTTGSAHARVPTRKSRARRLRTAPESAYSLGTTGDRAGC